MVAALAQDLEQAISHQARSHGTPIYAANLSASDHVSPVVPKAMTDRAMDILEETAGEVINRHLPGPGVAPSRSSAS
jgi:hypothetical protein